MTSILSFLFLGESLVLRKVWGILITLIGVVLVSINFEKLRKEMKMSLLFGAKWAGLSALCMGVAFFGIALIGRDIGWFSANVGLRLFMVLGLMLLVYF